jgi:hypothetical protein
MSELFEFKIDPNKYVGMSTEEAERAMEADRIRAINEDPRTIAAVRSAEHHDAERKAEQERLIEENRQRQQAKVAAEWENEKQRRLPIWLANGGTKDEFEAVWPEMRRKIAAEKVERFEREREAFRI